jgi:hypothetical protein
MLTYQYRIVHRLKSEHWQKPRDAEWTVWHSSTNPSGRPYQNLSGIKAAVTRMNSDNTHPWQRKFEYKIQRFPLTQEWEDIDD